MSQAIFPDINPVDTNGDELAILLDDFRDAVVSGFKGPTRPTGLQAGGYWIDDSSEVGSGICLMKYWTGTNDVILFTLNTTTNEVSVGGAVGSFNISKLSADNAGPILEFIKSRVSGGGQTQPGDILGEMDFKCTTNTGVETISAVLKVVGTNNATGAQSGAYLAFEAVDTNSAALLEKFRIVDGKVGLGTTTPLYMLHAKGSAGIGTEIEGDNTTAPKLTFRKKRVTTNGKVLSGDFITKITSSSTDQTGAEITDAFTMEVSASEDHTSTTHGTAVEFKTKDATTIIATTKLSFGDGVAKTLNGLWSKFVRVGTSVTAATNIKIQRSGTGAAQVVLGNDATAEGSKATVLGQLGLIIENFLNASKPSNDAANKGRVIYVTDTNKFEYDTGAAWAGLGGGALVPSAQLALTSAAAIQFAGTTPRQLFTLKTTTGEQDLSALSPQIQAATDIGQELVLVGTSDTDYPILKNGNGLKLNGDWIGSADTVLKLVWVNSKWIETGRT